MVTIYFVCSSMKNIAINNHLLILKVHTERAFLLRIIIYNILMNGFYIGGLLVDSHFGDPEQKLLQTYL